MHSCQIKDDPEESVGNRFTIGELNSNQGFAPALPHFCLKKQLHSNDHGLMNEPKLTIDESKTLSKKSLCKLEGNLDRRKMLFHHARHSFAFCSEDSLVKILHQVIFIKVVKIWKYIVKHLQTNRHVNLFGFLKGCSDREMLMWMWLFFTFVLLYY